MESGPADRQSKSVIPAGPAAFLDWGQEADSDLHAIRSVWDGLRQGKEFPGRRDINPLAFGKLLNLISIAELLDGDPWLRFRLVCTEAELRVGRSLKGYEIYSESSTPGARIVRLICDRMLSGRLPVLAWIPLQTGAGISLDCMAAAFPLSEDPGRIDHLLLATSFRALKSARSAARS